MGEPSTVDRLVAELHTGAPEEPGTFSVDAASADRKLRALRLDNPLHWVLVGLRGAVRAGASRIEAFEEAGDLILQWPEPIELPTGSQRRRRPWRDSPAQRGRLGRQHRRRSAAPRLRRRRAARP